MSIRRKVGRFRVLVAAVLLAIGTLALPATMQPAHAQQGCFPQPNIIPTWSVLYDDRGVTLCRGDGPAAAPDLRAYVHIIDLDADAEVRLHSERVNPFESASNHNQYNKRVVEDWFGWIQSNVAFPDTSRLFSTTNASFFIDTSAPTTALSLPQRTVHAPFPITNHTYGNAQVVTTPPDPAWNAEKRILLTRGSAGAPIPPTVEIQPFPTHYTKAGVDNIFFGGTSWHGTVGLAPLEGSGAALRNFVGWDGSRVYILATTIQYSLSQAQSIIRSFGSIEEIQLDGGGSTQMYYETDDGQSGEFGIIGREVPDVLAVYLAPN